MRLQLRATTCRFLHWSSLSLAPALAVALGAGLILAAGAPAARAQYNFTRIANTGSTFSGFSGTAGVNVNGTLAFTASLTAGGSGIYEGSATTTASAIAATSGGTYTSFSGPVAVNAFGQTAFTSVLSSGKTAVEYQPATGSGTDIGDTGTTYSGFGSSPSINGRGTVAFEATLKAGGAGIYTVVSGTTTATAVLTTGTSYSSPTSTTPTYSNVAFSSFGDPSLNGKGSVAAYGTTTTGSQWVLLSAGGGSPLVVAQTGASTGSFSAFVGVPDLSTVGTVVFAGTLVGGGSGVYTGTGDGVATAISTGATDGFSSYSQAAINGSGIVGFEAVSSTTGAVGIYIDSGASPVKVVAVGDTLDGSTVTGLTLGRDGLNDSGQIGFLATLADGRMGVYLGSSSTPEPSTIALCLISTFGLGLRIVARSRRRAGVRG